MPKLTEASSGTGDEKLLLRDRSDDACSEGIAPEVASVGATPIVEIGNIPL